MSTRAEMRERLLIQAADVAAVNAFLASPDNPFVNSLIDVVEKYGGVEQINRAADEPRRLETRLARLREKPPPYLADTEWLAAQRDAGAFVTLPGYRRAVLGAAADTTV